MAKEGALTPAEDSWFELPADEFLRRWYGDYYNRVTYSGVAGRIQRWMHRSIERGYTQGTRFDDVLEVGGNRGEHLPFVRHQFSSYILSDIHTPDADLPDLQPEGVNFQVVDVQSMPFPDETFDRVLNTCVLHHVPEPEAALTEIRRVLRPGGTADIFVSADPGLLFRVGRWAGPKRDSTRMGLKKVKSLVDARDHRTHVGSLCRLIEHVFREDQMERRSYPLGLPGWNGSLWLTYRVKRH